jgi:sugar phosphate isomerase/epimerase
MKKIIYILAAALMLAGCSQKKEIGIQLYSLHQNFNDIEGVLDSLSKIGYTTVETLNGGGDPNCFGIAPADFKALCDSKNLTITSTHGGVALDRVDEAATLQKWSVLFDALRTMGAKYCVIPGYNFGSTIAEMKQSCDHLNRAGALAHEYGLQLGMHNHKGDFNTVEGEVILDYVIKNTDPDKFFIELDVCPHNMGTADPLHYLKTYPDRIKVLHVKDEKELAESGKVDFEAIFKQFYKNGWEDAYVEYELPFWIGDNQQENEKNLKELWQGIRRCHKWMSESKFVK